MADTQTVVEVNCETGEAITRPLNEQELAQLEKDRAEAKARQDAIIAEEKAKAEAKASAVAKFTALGLTEDEAKAIAG